jgi:hypothetical protein
VHSVKLLTCGDRSDNTSMHYHAPLYTVMHSSALSCTIVHLHAPLYTSMHTLAHYHAQLYTVMHHCTLLCTLAHYHTLLYTCMHHCTLSCTAIHYSALSCTIIIMHYHALCVLLCTIMHYHHHALSYTIIHYDALSHLPVREGYAARQGGPQAQVTQGVQQQPNADDESAAPLKRQALLVSGYCILCYYDTMLLLVISKQWLETKPQVEVFPNSIQMLLHRSQDCLTCLLTAD